MKIFGMGGLELVIILVVILIIFGPKNLPKLGNALGKTVSNLRSGMNEGKKKKEEEAATEATETPVDDDESAAAPKPAELNGEVEEVISEPTIIEGPVIEEPPAEELVLDDSPATSTIEFALAESTPIEPATDEPTSAESSAEGNEPKKVRRVVKKKVSTE